MRGERDKNGKKPNPFNVIFKFKSDGTLEFFDKQQIIEDGAKGVTHHFNDFSKKNFKFVVIDEMYYYAGFDCQTGVYKNVTDIINVYSGDKKVDNGTVEQLKKDGVFKSNSMSCCMRLVVITANGRFGYLDLSALGRDSFFEYKNGLGKGVEYDFIIAGTKVVNYEVKAPNSEKKITKTATVPVFENWTPAIGTPLAAMVDTVLTEWKKYLAGEKSELLPSDDQPTPAATTTPATTPAATTTTAETPAPTAAQKAAATKAAKAAAAVEKQTPPDFNEMPKAGEDVTDGDGEAITDDLPF